MTRLIDALLQETFPDRTPRHANGSDECLRARPASPEDAAERVHAFLSLRLRGRTMGAKALARLAEDARRYARLLAAVGHESIDVRPSWSAWERPLEAYAVELQS